MILLITVTYWGCGLSLEIRGRGMGNKLVIVGGQLTRPCNCVYIQHKPQHHMYRIAGNFRGRKFSWISRLRAIRESFLREIWGRAAPTYDWFQAIRESFLPRKFTAIWYSYRGQDLIQTIYDKPALTSLKLQ